MENENKIVATSFRLTFGQRRRLNERTASLGTDNTTVVRGLIDKWLTEQAAAGTGTPSQVTQATPDSEPSETQDSSNQIRVVEKPKDILVRSVAHVMDSGDARIIGAAATCLNAIGGLIPFGTAGPVDKSKSKRAGVPGAGAAKIPGTTGSHERSRRRKPETANTKSAIKK